MKLKLLLISLLTILNLNAATVGEVPKQTEISGDNGGYVEDGSAWDSSSIKDKVYVMFYVDPDEKDVNKHYSSVLKVEKEAKRVNFQSIAIINLAATWKPNFIIEKLLKSKQEEFPNTIYVKDKNSVLVNEWEIEDDASNILIFSKNGTLLFYKSGAMSDSDIEKSLKIIKENS
ncbi:MAG: YtfJ family protein [Campylobacterota bacterium]|nr:YtfJ family protein [Campylobacterota bacterium]